MEKKDSFLGGGYYFYEPIGNFIYDHSKSIIRFIF